MRGLVLFDLDNTLVDRQAAFRTWAERFVAERSLGEHAVEVLCRADGDGFASREDLFTAVRDELALTEPLDALIAEYRSRYFDAFAPDPAVTGALQELRAGGWRIGIVTNGPATQHEKIRRAGLEPMVDGWCISDDVGIEKPDTRIFEEAIRRCVGPSERPAHVWMVGDTPHPDINGGIRAGFRTAWIRHGREWTMSDYQPDIVVDTVLQAVRHILAAPQ